MSILNLIATIFDDGEPNHNDSWLKHATSENLSKEREKVHRRWCSGEDTYDILDRFDKEISRRKWKGKEYGYPAHSEHGWHLPSK